MAVDGILNINKPSGKTSYNVVALVKRLSGERRVGHAGTLDPTATGVLPVCLGQGTRIIEFLAEVTKTYRARIELGVTTDTYDASGTVTQKRDPSAVSREQLELALAAFRGLTQQTPPMYSAVKHQGQRLYELARAGIKVARKSRPTQIYKLEIINWQPPVVTVEVECGKGTYIRSLAHDLGQSLGCGANLKSLIRLSYGPFDIKTAVSLPQLEDAFRYGYWQYFVHPIDTVLLPWRAMVVNDATENTIRNGAPVTLTNDSSRITGYFERRPSMSPIETHCRTYTLDGHFLGVLRFDSERGQWQPAKIFLSQNR
ncbi:MAG: tRNA pseudouridine(55) synthase TruB [Dehalococcoidales bacterium]